MFTTACTLIVLYTPFLYAARSATLESTEESQSHE